MQPFVMKKLHYLVLVRECFFALFPKKNVWDVCNPYSRDFAVFLSYGTTGLPGYTRV